MNLNKSNEDIENKMIQLYDDINKVIKNYIIFKPNSKDELQKAVDLWCDDKDKALNKYGHISNWNTFLINDMSNLFCNKSNFNEDISNWDVSNVTNMSYIFGMCKKFNQNINKWDVSSVTNMQFMFKSAS